MPVRVKLDAYDFQKYGTATGTVVFIAPDSHVPESEKGRSVPVYTIKVALDGDSVGRGADRGPIKLGMTGQAEIMTSKERILVLLVRSIRQSISLG
jgi:HlyD family secretion protein